MAIGKKTSLGDDTHLTCLSDSERGKLHWLCKTMILFFKFLQKSWLSIILPALGMLVRKFACVCVCTFVCGVAHHGGRACEDVEKWWSLGRAGIRRRLQGAMVHTQHTPCTMRQTPQHATSYAIRPFTVCSY